jgi:signal transduction histidine kinase
MFIVFLVLDYTFKSRHIRKLIAMKASEDKTPVLPRSQDFKDEVYSALLQDLYNTYTCSLRSMEDNFKENNEFMTAWVHEIKTPITTSKLLIESSDSENIESSTILSIKEELDKIDEYVEKVLYYSRSESFSKDYLISEVSVNNLVKESIKKHSIIFIRRHIKFVNNIEEKFLIDTDKKWLAFIIDQLVSNSLKYTGHNGSIKLTSCENPKEKILKVEDTGTGIKKEDMERLFGKAFTGSNGREVDAKATGLGLYLSQKLAKKLGHYITVESEYGKGTCVCIHFPKWDDYHITKM